MLKWLTKKAAQQSGKNIIINTKTLIHVANTADKRIESSGGQTDSSDIKKVTSAQKQLLIDIDLAISNGLDINDIINNYIKPVVESKETSPGAILAINHVLSYRGGAL